MEVLRANVQTSAEVDRIKRRYEINFQLAKHPTICIMRGRNFRRVYSNCYGKKLRSKGPEKRFNSIGYLLAPISPRHPFLSQIVSLQFRTVSWGSRCIWASFRFIAYSLDLLARPSNGINHGHFHFWYKGNVSIKIKRTYLLLRFTD